MKKTAGLIVVVALLGAIYTGTSWFMGKQIEGNIDQQYKLLEAVPYAKIVKRNYQRGLFSSDETVTFEFFGEMMRSLAKAQAAKGQPADMPKNFQLTAHTRIQHGPFPGFSMLAAATSESELILPDSDQKELKRIFGDKKPISSQTVFHFDGSFSSIIKSPGATVTLPQAHDGSVPTFVWESFEAKFDSAPNMQHYTMHGRVPKIEIKDNKDTHFLLSNIRFQADQKRIFQDEPFLFSGSERFSIDEVRADKALTLKTLTYRTDTSYSGDFIDVAAKMGIEEILMADKKYGPAHFDSTFKHLHARTVAGMYHAMLKMYAKPADFSGQPAAAGAQMLAPMLEQIRNLLAYNPEFSIDRISFVGPDGETSLAARVKLNDVSPDDLNNPGTLLAKLDASGDATIPEALLLKIVSSDGPKQTKAGADPKKDRAAMVQEQIARFSEQGYISNENELIKVHAEFKQGQLKLNGQPFPSTALQAKPARQATM